MNSNNPRLIEFSTESYSYREDEISATRLNIIEFWQYVNQVNELFWASEDHDK